MAGSMGSGAGIGGREWGIWRAGLDRDAPRKLSWRRPPERRADTPSPRPIPMPSDSYAKIYAVVRRIPAGRVATYGQVAELAGLPNHARLVGYALHAVAEGSSIPWHRVLNAQGRISIRGSVSATVTQRVRLEQEGVRFAAGRVKLDEFGWKPRRPARRGATRSADR